MIQKEEDLIKEKNLLQNEEKVENENRQNYENKYLDLNINFNELEKEIYRDDIMRGINNYDKEVFNGDIGTVEKIDIDERTLIIRFDDRSIEYDVTELDEIVLAYATTVHKAQGAEYPLVVMPIMMTHFAMLQRNLLYTGVTRAKKGLVLVGQKKAVAYCVRNVTVDERNTLLAERLKGTI